MQQSPDQPYNQNFNHPYQPQAMYPPYPSQEQVSDIPQQSNIQQPYAQQQMMPQQPYAQQQMMPQQPYAPQQMMPQQPYAPQLMFQQPPAMAQNVNVTINNGKQHGLFIRALYFCFIGWWLGFAWLNIGYFCVLSVVLLPLGLVMLNRLPQVITLRPSSGTNTNINVSTTMVQAGMGGPAVMQNSININVNTNNQTNFLVRVLYFCAIGWWAGYFWACVGYSLVCSIILMPIGLMMLNRLPAVLTLRKN